MPLTQEQKSDLIKRHGRHEKDSGSPEAQIALLTKRINQLTQHLKLNPKDFSCQRGLMMLVGQRRRLQAYFKRNTSLDEYKALLKKFKLRK